MADDADVDVNEVRANAFRNYANNLDNNILHNDARQQFLQDIHKVIAKKRIARLLEDHGGRGAVLATALPNRAAGDVNAAGGAGHTIALTNNRDYENYAAIIDAAGYDEAELNGFVAEIAGKIALTRGNAAKVTA